MEQVWADEAVIARLASGDREALGLLYDRYSGPVYALLLRIVADRHGAEDLLQEVFLRVWQRAATYQATRGRPLTWVLGIAHHLAIDETRRRQRRPQGVGERGDAIVEDVLTLLPSEDLGPAELAWQRQRRAQIVGAMRQLPQAQRTVIELAYFGGYTQSQMAEQLGEPLGTVKTRLRLGIHKLRDLLEGQGLEVDIG